MKRIVFISALFSLLIVAACKKNKGTSPSPANVKIELSSPEAGHIYRSGEMVHVMADVSYTEILHGYELTITDTLSGTVVLDTAEHLHADSFVVHQMFSMTGTQPMVLKLSLVAEIDHSGEAVEKELFFKYQP